MRKISLSRPDFVDSEIAIWGLTSLTSTHFVKKTSCVRLPIENLFCPNNASEPYNSISWQNQKLLSVGNQLQDSNVPIWD